LDTPRQRLGEQSRAPPAGVHLPFVGASPTTGTGVPERRYLDASRGSLRRSLPRCAAHERAHAQQHASRDAKKPASVNTSAAWVSAHASLVLSWRAVSTLKHTAHTEQQDDSAIVAQPATNQFAHVRLVFAHHNLVCDVPGRGLTFGR